MMPIPITIEGQWIMFPLASLDLEPHANAHHVRLRCLERHLFPSKWLSRAFAAGELKVEAGIVRILVFKPVEIRKDASYRLAEWPALPSPHNDAVRVLVEDDWCLVVDKPAGMAVHPNGPSHRGTLDEWVARHMLSRGSRVFIKHIHRLDDDTAGPVLYAKSELAGILLDEAMRERRIERSYEAVVEGRLDEPSGTIDAPIGRDRHHAARRRVSPAGEHAVTHYRVLHLLRRHTRVEVELETGRTHQIRVHCAHFGHPLVGDSLYGGSTKLLEHQALRATRLTFPHPLHPEQSITALSPEPAWYTALLAKIES